MASRIPVLLALLCAAARTLGQEGGNDVQGEEQCADEEACQAEGGDKDEDDDDDDDDHFHGCDVGQWVSAEEAPGEEGFHVLCVMNMSTIYILRNGVWSENPLTLELDSELPAGDFRSTVASFLGIKSTIEYSVKGKGQLRWQKQPWTLFTVKGVELRVGTEAKKLAAAWHKTGQPMVTLLFEGGVWRWPTIRVGYKRRVMPGVTLTTVARQPAVFKVNIDLKRASTTENPLDNKLLSEVISLAKDKLEASSTEGRVDKNMRSSDQTFLAYSQTPSLRRLSAATAKLLRGHEDTLEALQVLRYQEKQHYDAHRDYWDPREFPDVQRFSNREGYWHMRHATLLWYLEAPAQGGETWFPRAHGGPVPVGEWNACDGRGVKVAPGNTTAVLFYNLRADGEIDENSWHSGCPVIEGVKWAANSWMANCPRGTRPMKRRPQL